MFGVCWSLAFCNIILFGTNYCLADITTHPKWKLFDHDQCGESIANRIIGGTSASLGQFPWMARIGYEIISQKQNVFICGGSLINPRYVLTAAHCIKSAKDDLKLVVVRLGENVQSEDEDCQGDICAPPVQDIEPEKVILHEHFHQPNRMKNDIALIRLKEEAELTPFVTPICLPYGNIISRDYIDQFLQVAGWGLVDSKNKAFSDDLQFVRVPMVALRYCDRAFPSYKIGTSTQYCAGGQFGFDSCGGDSGGPLMKLDRENNTDTPRYYIIGVVSFGATECGGEFPAVYTKVGAYLHWILDNIKS